MDSFSEIFTPRLAKVFGNLTSKLNFQGRRAQGTQGSGFNLKEKGSKVKKEKRREKNVPVAANMKKQKHMPRNGQEGIPNFQNRAI